MPLLQVEYLPIEQLRPHKRNARKHPKRQLRQIANSIRTFGFRNPILVDQELTVLAGHARLDAAKIAGLDQVPCVRQEGLTTEQKRAFILADNKLALNAEWDEQILAEELQELLKLDINFDIEVTGFSAVEIDSLVESLEPEEPGNPEERVLPDPDDVRPHCRRGDIWQMGPSRPVCGDALDPETVRRLMDGEKPRLIFTDPPWNREHGDIGGQGKTKHRSFAMASGEMTREQFTACLRTCFQNLAVGGPQ